MPKIMRRPREKSLIFCGLASFATGFVDRLRRKQMFIGVVQRHCAAYKSRQRSGSGTSDSRNADVTKPVGRVDE